MVTFFVQDFFPQNLNMIITCINLFLPQYLTNITPDVFFMKIPITLLMDTVKEQYMNCKKKNMILIQLVFSHTHFIG